MDAGYRSVMFFFTNAVGRIILGLACLIGGLYYGVTSRTITYQQVELSNYSGDVELQSSTIYIQDQNTHDLYLINFGDFTEFFDYPELNQHIIILTYDATPSPINITTADGTKIQGTGFHVLKVAILNDNYGVTKTFATKQYTAHPTSYFDDRWLYGSIPITIGLFFLLFTLIGPTIAARYAHRKKSRLSEKEINKHIIEQTGDAWNNNGRFREPPDYNKIAR
jgi:hypothetical protein